MTVVYDGVVSWMHITFAFVIVCLCTFEMCVTIPLSPLISSSSSITVFKACANSTANIHYVQQFQHLTAPNLITASNMPWRPRGRHWRTYGPFVMQKCKVGLTHSEGRLLHNISWHKLSASVIAPLLRSHFACNACELWVNTGLFAKSIYTSDQAIARLWKKQHKIFATVFLGGGVIEGPVDMKKIAIFYQYLALSPKLYKIRPQIWKTNRNSYTTYRTVPFPIIIIIITDLYSAFRSEDTEALDAAQED